MVHRRGEVPGGLLTARTANGRVEARNAWGVTLKDRQAQAIGEATWARHALWW